MTSNRRFFDRSGSYIEKTASARAGAGSFGVATNPERFAPLHEVATALLEQLTRDFEVVRTEGLDLDPTPGRFGTEATLVKLTPTNDEAAPLVVVFTSFPGLFVRMGRWHTVAFPACGCDGCGETVTEQAEQFSDRVHSLVAGRLQEAVEIPFLGRARLTYRLRHTNGQLTGAQYISRAEARAVVGRGPREFNWVPWQRRDTSQAGGLPPGPRHKQ